MSEYSRQQRDLRRVHHLADHQQPVAVGRLAQQPQPFFAEALKTVRRTARLERAAADHPARPPLRHHLRRALDLLAALHAARAGHHDHALAADLDVADLDHRAARPEAAARQLVRRDDAVRFLHALHHLEHREVEIVLAAHAAEHGVDHARGAMHVEAHLDHAVDHALDLLFGGALLHHH